MKKTLAKQSLLSLVAGFFLFGLMLLSANRAGAQDINHNWMQADQAQQALKAEMTTLSNALTTLTPGTPEYNNTLAHAHYYRVINRLIENGAPVSEAVLVNGPDVFNKDAVNYTPIVPVDAALKQQIQEDAIDLLTI